MNAITPTTDIKRLRKRISAAWQKRMLWDPLFNDMYDFVIPYRRSLYSPTPGQRLTDKVFDATAIDACTRFSGRMQQDVTPPFQQFFELFPGPLLGGAGDQKKKIAEDLNSIGEQVTAALTTSSFHIASAEMYHDLFCSTGYLLMLQGDQNSLIDCMSVPPFEMAMDYGPRRKIWGRFWSRTIEAGLIPEEWPNARLNDTLKQQVMNEQDKPVQLMQATTWNSRLGLWELHVLRSSGIGGAVHVGVSDDEPPIWYETYRKSPWITPGLHTVPGEIYARGPGMLAMPFIKTLNKVKELELKAAALSLFGMWTSTDDDIVNEKTLRFEPGAVWKVGSNGGGRGPSLAKLDVPGRFDLSHIVVEDERSQINNVTYNKRLPPMTGAVRSPTEIMERVRDLDIDLGGLYARISLECVQPVVERAIDILEGMKILETNLTINQLGVGLRVTSPIANAAKAQKAKRKVDYMQLLGGLVGPQAIDVFVRTETSLPQLGRDMGVDETDLRSTSEIGQKMDAMKQSLQAQQQAEAAAKAPPPTANQVAA